ncbi:MAG: glycoside hydrolase family 32 protein [Blastococcus sp.]|jgi:beta-fructofuranosidase|nr:glycoside hydrolase family 32 protein [Blastococcus sp.]
MTADPRRPGYHFTSPAGWINDPLAVTWHDDAEGGGRYELFYQFNPEAPVWAPACRWGQATAQDLVRWLDPRTALEPGPDETGCWSGSLVVDGGVPVIVYTSVLADAPGQGRIALAAGDPGWRRWTPDPAGPVIGAPAPELGLAHLRDPYVWRDGERWRMVVGAGSTTGQPSVLQWSSADLRSWTSDGVVAEPEPGQPGPGGTVWECPQLFRLDDAWALVVSVWDEMPGAVACALGTYDGRRFTARNWHRLAPGPCYATTVFLDAEGRRCAFSWLQETADAGGDWAGAISVPWLLGVDGDRVVVRPHPDVDTLRTGVHARQGPEPLAADPLVLEVPACADVVLRVDPAGGSLQLTLDEAAGRLLTVVADAAAGQMRISGPDAPESCVLLRPEPDGAVELRILLDAGIVEAFPGGGAVAAARLRPSGGALRMSLSAAGEGARLHDLVVHGMERVIG